MAELNLDRILLGNAEGRNLLNTDKNFQQIQKEINLNKNEFQTFKDEIEENLNNAIIELDANVIKVTPTPVDGKTPTQYINSPVIINGDFQVTGTTTTVDTDTLKVKDNLIVANSTGASLTKPSGLAIATGTASGTSYPSAYGIVYDPSTETVKLGKGTLDSNYEDFVFNQNEGKPIALRADSTTFRDGNIIKWDSTNNIFVDGGIAYNEIGVINKDNTWSGINTFSSFKALNGSYGFHLDALGLYSTPLTVTTFTDGEPNSMIGTKYGHGSIVYDPENLGTTYTLTIPKKSGTIATLDDIQSVNLTDYGKLAGTNSWTGTNIFNSETTFTSKIQIDGLPTLGFTSASIKLGNHTISSNILMSSTANIKLPNTSGTLATLSDIKPINSYFENCESVTAANDINIVPETNKRWVTINYNYGETEGELYWALKFSLDENVIDIFNEQKEKIATQMIFNTNTGEEGIFYIISPYVEGESSPMCYARFIGINTFN